MTLNELAATLTREAGSNLARAIKAMPPEKQAWRPMDSGRSPIDQVAECAAFNFAGAQSLRDRKLPPMTHEQIQAFKTDHDTADTALAALKQSTGELIEAIKRFPADRLDEEVELTFAPGIIKSFGWKMMCGYWNTIYHWGQINYIQTLYGDIEMH